MKNFLKNGGEYNFKKRITRPVKGNPVLAPVSSPDGFPKPINAISISTVEVIDISSDPALQSLPIEQSILVDDQPVAEEENNDVSAEVIQDKPIKRKGRPRKLEQ
jgi:hypothetical protein